MDEHQVIETDLDIFREGHYIPEGTSGVIVSVLAKDEAYYVEFPNLPNNPVILCYHHELGNKITD